MVFTSKRIHQLPRFPAGVCAHYKAMSKEVNSDDLRVLESEVRRYPWKLARGEGSRNGLPLELAHSLGDISLLLIKKYEELSPRERAMVVGAIRYFVDENDCFPESTYGAGLTDDAEVMNFVLEELNLKHHCVEPVQEE
jgi:hypothetical protein